MSTILEKGKVKSSSARRALAKPRPKVSNDGMLSIEAWLALPDTKPRYELINGQLVQKMTTTTAHAWAAGKMLIMLDRWGDERGWHFLPEGTGLRFDDNNGAVPDLLGFTPYQTLRPEIVNHTEVPFLAVEILSRSTARADRQRKKQQYAALGVQLYLIVDTSNQTLEIYRLNTDSATYGEAEVLAGDDIWQPQEFSGLQLQVARLWM